MYGLAGLNRKNEGNQIFADELKRFAHESADQRVQAIADRTAAPLRVLVRGRRGVGCSTVARALDIAGRPSGIHAVERAEDPGAAADLEIYVIAEVVKPEDRTEEHATASALTVLTKADLTGLRGDGPVAVASGRCAEFAPLLGTPTLPMSGLLAVAALEGLDAQCWAALQALGDHPGTAYYLDHSFDGFLTAQLPVSVPARRRLLAVLDLFGTALAVEALRQGAGAGQLRALLRKVSGVDAVIASLVAAGAAARYRRVLDAVDELDALAVTDAAVSEFLVRDATVVARMSSALDAMQAGGLAPGPVAPLPRAVHWQRFCRTPRSDLHRACGADIVRGALRLWSRSGAPVHAYRESP